MYNWKQHNYMCTVYLSQFYVCRLREIEMSEYDAETYESFSGHVRRQVQAMRVIIDSLQVHALQYNKQN